jgi:hypothetical protein
VWVGNFRGDGAVFEGGQLAGDPDSPPDSKILIDKLTPNSFRWTFHVTQDGGHSFDLVQARRHTRATAPPVPELAPAALPDAVPAQSPEG